MKHSSSSLTEGLGRRIVECSLFWMGVFALAAGLLFYIPAIAPANTTPERRLPIYCVQTEEPLAALSFDAAWGADDLPVILDILAQYEVRATFFMTGEWVRKFPEAVLQIAAAGHDLANHGDTHAHLPGMTPEQMTAEIMGAHEEVLRLTGITMDLFRPSYGDYDDAVIAAAEDCGYYAVQWDVDSLDWKDYGADAIVRTVCEHKNLSNGSIVLLHNGATYTAAALERVITGLQAQGYTLVPLSELIYRENYHMNHEGRQVPN